jgi:HTH-type transcriptional regulator, transcriptional repressor of NAD biosynthesis genes
MKTEKIGMTLGKFAPFHKGHQLLIEEALKQVDRLVVMVYDAPEIDGIPPLPIRAKWIRLLYPQVEVIEAWNSPPENGYSNGIKEKHDNYIRCLLKGRKITHFFASEPYVYHVSKAIGAEPVMVDRRRIKVPVSGTKIRSDLYKNREHLDPLIYRDLITNVVLLGGPSTGKSTLAEALAKEYNTNFMPEYGREYWNKHQTERRLTTGQLLEIAHGHLEQEDRFLESSNKYLFTDTNAITTYLFSLNYHGRAEPELYDLARKCSSRYDLVFLCETDIPFEVTWDRSGDANRSEMQRRTISFLQEHKIPYFTIKGSLEERICQVKDVLGRYRKYQNVAELQRSA